MGVMPGKLNIHPRLLADEADWTALGARLKVDPVTAKMVAALRAKAESLWHEPIIERKLVGPRMIQVAQRAVKELVMLAFMYKLSGESRFAQQAKYLMQTIAGWENWNPGHFLDTAEVMLAMAIGYDWLYDEMDEGMRKRIAEALVEKGMKRSMEGTPHWLNSKSNWSTVCYGGVAAAAIALADEQPELAERILTRVVEKVPLAVATLEPDGAWPAGPTYWLYGMEYLAMLIAALEKAFGSNFGLDACAGLAKTGQYLNDMTTGTGGFYCYTDGDRKREMAAALYWLAARFGQPQWLDFDIAHLDEYLEEFRGGRGATEYAHRMLPLVALWHRAVEMGDKRNEMGSVLYRGDTPVTVLRAGSIYAGMKGGYAASDHGHMDVGSFLLEADGVRWALDLGREDYGAVESHGIALWNMQQDSPRWNVFRIGPEGHNIARFGKGSQKVDARAEFVRFGGEGENLYCVLDLTKVYGQQVAEVRRGMKLMYGKAVLIQDEWSGSANGIRWQMLTEAQTTVAGRSVFLRQDGEMLELKVLGKAEILIRVERAETLTKPHDSPNPGVRRISIACAEQSGILPVLAIPGSAEQIELPAIYNAMEW